MRELQEKRRNCVQESRGLKERIERFEAQRPYAQFGYRDPETNFNRRSVSGVVCRLVKLKNHEAATAIETAAGGRVSFDIRFVFVYDKLLVATKQQQQKVKGYVLLVAFILYNKLWISFILQLYNVIVDTSETSKKLLQRGNLQHRTTFIPLNKIQGGKINPNIVKFAQDLVRTPQ